MSQTTNNRQKVFEDKSTRGPRRKLKLIIEDGKRYIKKEDLLHYFFQENWNIEDFNYHFGIGHRIVRGSLYKWFTREEIEESHRKKIANKQRGSNNSNRVNWYKPRKLIPLLDLEEAIKKSTCKRDLKERLQLTTWELSSIQQFYNFKLPNKSSLLNTKLQYSLSKEDVKLLCKVITGMQLEDLFFSNTPQAIYKIDCLVWELKKINRSLRRAFRKPIVAQGIKFSTNLIEYKFHKALEKMGIEHEIQYYIPEHNIHLDFLIQGHYNLELDGNLHEKEADMDRDYVLKSLGYRVIRLDLKTLGITRFSKEKEVRKCIKKLVLPKLNS